MSEAHLSLRAAREAGLISALDEQLAMGLSRMAGGLDLLAQWGVAGASRQVAQGHLCLELPRLAGQPMVDSSGAPVPGASWPDLGPWLAALRQSPLLEGPGSPLVLDEAARLYLRRWHQIEGTIARVLRQRSAPEAGLDAALLEAGVVRLFPEGGEQADAARLALERRLAVIAGGPGTGKTTTVVKLLALLIEQSFAAGRPAPRLLLLAPTGKAAARLVESIRRSKGKLQVDPHVLAAIPEEARTIHRGLGVRASGGFHHGPQSPLPDDLVLVDEASMVDAALLAALLGALRPEARLILLGDPDQLASVEAGAVLGDVCAAPALRPAVARLRRSHRFDPTRGVGALARAIREGQADQAVAALRDPAHARELRWSSLPRGEALGADLQALIVAGYRPLLKAVWPEQALAQMERFRVLCAHRRGLHGVEGLNRLIEQALTDARLIRPIGRWYAGRPVMITVNDYALQLYNGDVGIILPDPVDRSLRAFFPGSDGALRGISPARLPAHETVWAMSIHKSQGSEFNEVAVVLPDRPSPLLTRELIYTAVTRARDAVHLYAPEEELRLAIGRRVQRASGLVEALGSA